MVRVNRLSIPQALFRACPILVLACGMAGAARGQGLPTVRHVGTSSDCTYGTIQSAIDASLAGDIVRIQG